MTNADVRRGAGIYSKTVLSFYDLLVVQFSNSKAWRCPSPLMLAQYDRCLARRHLDVGPGTGWFLAHAQMPDDVEVTLMDLNANSIESASARLGETPHAQLVANVLEPLPDSVGPFDSIGTNYLFHCVPGGWVEKGAAFMHLADRLTDDGVLFGSIILGKGVRHNLIGRGFMSLYNRMGIFHNHQDDAHGLERALCRAFDDVEIEVSGTVAMYRARTPRRPTDSARSGGHAEG